MVNADPETAVVVGICLIIFAAESKCGVWVLSNTYPHHTLI